MHEFINEQRGKIKKVIDSFHKIYEFKHIYLFKSFKERIIHPLLHIGSGSSTSSPLEFSEDVPPIPGKFLSCSEAQNEVHRLIFNHFDLQILCLLESKSEESCYLGIASINQNVTESDWQVIKLIVDSIGNILKNHILNKELNQLSKRTQQMISEIGTLHEITRAIESSQNLESLLKYIVGKSMNLVKSESASMMLVVEGTDELEFKIVLGPKSEEVKPFRLKIGKGIAGWVAKHGEAILIPDAYADPRFDPSFDKRSGYRTKSYLCVPLIYKDKVIGVMTVLNRLDEKPFNENDKELLSTFASQAALAIVNAKLLQSAIEKERLDKELQVASEIQHLLIPQEIPDVPKLDISAIYIPCREVSGDFYDIIQIDEQQYIFIVADVSGKGIPGAMLVSTMQATLKAYLEYSTDLLSVIENLNRRIIKNTTADRYITFFIGLYNSSDSSFTYINAGHNPPLLIQSDGQIIQLNKGGIFIGYMPWEYESEKIHLSQNSVLLLYTDGLVEAMNNQDEEFGENRLKNILKENQKRTTNQIKKEIIDKVNNHLGSNSLDDDFTLVLVKKNK